MLDLELDRLVKVIYAATAIPEALASRAEFRGRSFN
jgi:hypothetical protein